MAATERIAPVSTTFAAVVGIALLTLVPGRMGGSETHVRELLGALARVGTLDYRVLAPPLAPEWPLPTDIAREYGAAESTPGRLAAMARETLRSGNLADADVVHYPLTIALPRVREPRVVTLHDAQHLDLPQLFPRGERAFRTVAWHRSLRGAARVIALSDFVRRRALERLELDDARIRVVHSGVDHARFRPGDEQREPFLLYPARPWPHKNHARLYAAFAELRRERPELRLVLTGGGDFGPVPEGVELHGLVSDDEVASLYRRASALVFPSLYEGFGQPPLEAMACGCPVACSDAAALPEIVGDAARLFDPYDASAIAGAVRDVLADPEPWQARGLAQAARYSWDATARATEAVYAELL
jgi:glycosyltransferase involved in cell wall biosynthesis